MKLVGVKVRKKDAIITEQQAEDRFYAKYKPMMAMLKKNIKDIYAVKRDLHDSINAKVVEFEGLCRKVNITPSVAKSHGAEALLKSDYPENWKMKVEIGRMKNMEDHIDFMIKEIGPTVLSELGMVVNF